MKKIVIASLAFEVMVLLCAFTDTRLENRVTPVESERGVWMFLDVSEAEFPPVYRMYGDTLLTEYHDGERQWYAFEGDSAFYRGQESRLMKLVPEDRIPTSAFGKYYMSGVYQEVDSGRYCGRYAVGNRGFYRSSAPERVRAVFVENDTVDAVMVTEERVYDRWFIADSLGAGRVVSSRTRWFIDGFFLPVALSMSETLSDSTGVISRSSASFCMDFDGVEFAPVSRESRIDLALTAAEIRVENGTVTIGGAFPEGTTLRLHVTDIRGNSVWESEVDHGIGSVYRCDLPSLPAGQYVVTVSAGTPVSRKVIVTV